MSVNSNICLSFGLVSIDNFSSCYIFLLYYSPHNVFTVYVFWHIGYFSLLSVFFLIVIPINLLKLCLGMQLSYLKIVWFFQVIRLRFVRQDLSNTEVRTNFQFSSVTQSCPTLCDPMDCSTPGFPVHHQVPELTQTHAHRVGDAIQLIEHNSFSQKWLRLADQFKEVKLFRFKLVPWIELEKNTLYLFHTIDMFWTQ